MIHHLNGGEDIISSLPDEILCTILSLLPETKFAVRTSVLSHRWSVLWTKLSCFDFEFSNCTSPGLEESVVESFSQFVDTVISRKTSPKIEKFRLHYYDDNSVKHPLSRINDWVKTALSCGLSELDIELWFDCEKKNCFRKTEGLRLLDCSSLQVLKISSDICLRLPSALCFKNLKKLHVDLVEINDEFSNLFQGLPCLEELYIDIDCHILPCSSLCLNVPVLKVLEFFVNDDDWYSTPSVEVQICAPMLEHISLRDGFLYSYKFQKLPPNCQAIIDVGNADECADGDLDHGINLIMALSSANLISLILSESTMMAWSIANAANLPMFPYLKKLELFVDSSVWNTFLNFIRSAPNLETLILNVDMGDMELEENIVMSQTCSMVHLKEVEIWGPCCTEMRLKLVDFIMKIAENLEMLTADSVQII